MNVVPSLSPDPDTNPRWIGPQPSAVPAELKRALAPATHFVAEWTEYWVRWPDADVILCGTQIIAPVLPGTFRLRFENQLGIARLQPMRGGRPIGPAQYLEVIATKLGALEEYVAFLHGLLDDLFERCTRLPFALGGATARAARESLRPPSPLFVFHFLIQYGVELDAALSVVRSRPFRVLSDRRDLVPLGAVSYVDPEVALDALTSPERWRRSRGMPLASRMDGYAPERVLQRLPELSSDNPENRFVRAFVEALTRHAADMPRQLWWTTAPGPRKRAILDIADALARASRETFLRDLHPSAAFPSSSRVMQRREGYRDLSILWQRFQRARRAVFEPLDRAIELRRVDELYQTWVFFVLVEEIAAILGETPTITFPASDTAGLAGGARADFTRGALFYDTEATSYSVRFRPDYLWRSATGDKVVFDAKFRIDDDLSAKNDDLTKMHAYRDALCARAALCVFPGAREEFFPCGTGTRGSRTLREILFGDAAGVGSLARSPLEVQ